VIKASVTNPNNPIFILGLSEVNVQRLKAGQPILTSLKSFGVEQAGQVVILYGQTEQAIADDMVRNGMIGNETVFVGDPKMDAIDAIPRKTDKLLIATVGLPRSGKSTWSQSQAYPIVNPDSIRLAIHGQRFIGEAEPFVWATAKAMVSALFLAGHSVVVLDACNNTRRRRDEWKSDKWDTVFKVINETKETCLERAKEALAVGQDWDMELLGVIDRMAAEHEPLGEDEIVWP
jgi:predicted kinase